MAKKRVVSIVIIVVIAVFITGAVISKKRKHYVEIEAKDVKTTDLSREVSANGEIRSLEHVKVVSKTGGTIARIFVKEGEYVKKNKLLVLIDSEKILVQRQSAVSALESAKKAVKSELLNLRAGYIQAKTDYEQAKRNLKNTEEMYKIGSASDQQLSSAKDSYEIAKEKYISSVQRLNLREGRGIDDPVDISSSIDKKIVAGSIEVKHAEANLNAVDTDLKNCSIKAAISGVITELPIEQGDIIAPGSEVARIQNPDKLEVTVNIDEVDIGYVKIGQKAKIESDAFIDHTLYGKVFYIAPVIKRVGDSRVCEIKINLNDPEKYAKIGASSSIYITVEKRSNVPAIGIDQYIFEKNKKYAYKLIKLKDSTDLYKIVKTEIKTGIIGIEKVEILSGLKEGDKIAAGDLKSLSDGQTVKLKEKKKKKDKNDKAS